MSDYKVLWELSGQLWNPFAQEHEEAVSYGDFATRDEAAKAAQQHMEHPKDRFYANQVVGPSRSCQYGSPISMEGPPSEKYVEKYKANVSGINPDWLEKTL